MIQRMWSGVALCLSLLLASAVAGQSRIAARSGSRDASILETRAGLAVSDATLETALSRLTETSGVLVAFSPSLLRAGSRRVVCDCAEATVGETLRRLLEGTPFRYSVLDGQVVVTPKPNPAMELAPKFPRVTTVALGEVGGSSLERLVPRRSMLPQEWVLSGTVVESRTAEPVSGAQVVVEGTGRGGLTDDEGRFRIGGLTAPQVTIRVAMLGYRTVVQTVNRGSPSVRIALVQTAIDLGEILVTVAGEQSLREVGSAIARVNADSVAETAPVSTFTELLSSRAPGVNVLFSSGTAIGASRIRIRGSSSPSLSNEPLIYVDGVAVNADPQSISIRTNSQQPSRLNDINPNEIKSIEVLKGPAASTLYGTRAANGVILITTKSGAVAAEGSRWHFWMEGGLTTDPNDYPDNVGAVDAQGQPCPLSSVVAGSCSQAEVRTFNLLENSATTPFETGVSFDVGGSVSGSSGNVNYFVSGEVASQEGVYASDQVDKVNVRANMDLHPTETIDLQLNTGYISNDLDVFIEGGTQFGPVTNGLLGRASEDGWFLWSPEETDQIVANQEIERFIGSATAQFRLSDWLQLRATGGLDALHRNDNLLFPVGVFAGAFASGQRFANRFQTLNYTAELLGRVELPVSDVLTSRTSVGTQYFVDQTRATLSEGQQLVPGSNSLATAAVSQAVEGTTEARTLGIFAEQQFGYRDRLFLTGGLRADDNSTFGREFDIVVYPKVSVSWVLSEEDFFPSGSLLSSLRLRAAWGQSGSQPGATDAIQFFSALPATTPDGGDEIGATFQGGGLGNPNLKPERSSEVEFGFEAGLADERIALSLTYYRKNTRDALVFREVAPSVGATGGRWENLAETENKGVEGLIDALIFDRDEVEFRLLLSGSYNDNSLIELGEGVSPINVGQTQRHVEGSPLGGYWGRPIVDFTDQNGDGILAAGEVTIGDTAVFIGEALPPLEASVQPSLSLFDRVRIGALLDIRAGHSLYNFTDAFRCNLANSRARHDPTTPLDEQAECVAFSQLGVNSGYIQDADFAKLREVTLTLLPPSSWTRPLGLERASVTFAGRNLGTWTEYPGIDPEANRVGSSNFQTEDFFQPAQTRRWTLRVNVTF